jgi:polyhydroxybutyrate depolymerase
MNVRRILAGVLLAAVVLPAALVAAAVATIYALDRTTGTILSSGTRREYLLYVPRTYDPKKPTPLVISMHGAMLWPAAQMAITRWNRVADQHGLIVVYPAGSFGRLARAWPVDSERGRRAEVRYISDLIDELERSYNIDRRRIYANGLSNGGAMAFVLSCTLSGRIAAVGTVAAAETVPWTWCPETRPVPLIAFHGTADPIVPYGGGTAWSAKRPFPSVRAWTANWAARNGCTAPPVESETAPDVARLQYGGCVNDADVVLYTVARGGHAWPGGTPLPRWIVGPTTNGVDATAEMWEFFRRHPLPDLPAHAAHS